MRNYLILDGTDSRTFGLYINGAGTFSAPAREVSTLQIPGRNGDLIVKADRLQNYDLTYSSFIVRNFDANIAALRAFLLSKTSYFRLEDTYHPDEYRMAFYRGPFTPSVTQCLNAAKFDLVFNVKPQRFLKSGESNIPVYDGDIIINPTRFTARPLIEFYGNGSITIRSTAITISNNASRIMTIDCETMDCYTGSTSRNRDVSLSGNDFPKLLPGRNPVAVTLENTWQAMPNFKPRWWTV
jgi:phage-related protein